ncbi:MAG: type II CAAX endopeptidase family protein [Rhodothermales bacterium]
MKPTSLISRHSISAYFILTYVLSWGLWLPIVLGYDGILREILFVAGIFGPAMAAILTTWLGGGSVRAWMVNIVLRCVRARWWAFAMVIPVFLIGTASSAFAMLGNEIDLSLLPGRLGGYVPALVLTALIGGGRQEFGWRGFARPHLEKRYGPVSSTLILGVLWGLWHLPVVAADPEFHHGLDLAAFLPVALMSLASVAGYAFILTWLFNRTGSVLLAMLLHAGFNTAYELFVPLPPEAVAGTAYTTLSVTMTLTLAAVVLVLIAATRGRLGYGEDHSVDRSRNELSGEINHSQSKSS